MKRRLFLQHMTGLAGMIYLPVVNSKQPPPLSEARHTLAALHAHLLPTEPDAPGAAELHSIDYLNALLSVPQLPAAERTALIDGALKLAQFSQTHSGQAFSDLTEEQRERVLRDFESDSEGRAWLESQLHYLLEATLSDPLYGGNPNGIGWRWLAHNPGFPRPAADKAWFLLESV